LKILLVKKVLIRVFIMKILVISDVHSNIWALSAILSFEKDVDVLCCAGDLLDYGTTPVEVIDCLKSINISNYIVKGNHDLHVIETWKNGSYKLVSGREYKWVHHNCSRINEDHVDYLMQLPETIYFEADGYQYIIKHQYRESYETIDNCHQFNEFWSEHAPGKDSSYKNKRIIFGHTHQQCIHILRDDMVLLNPGSTSYRRPGDPDKAAQYMVIKDGSVELKGIPYERGGLLAEALVYKRNNSMMPSEIADFEFFFGD